MWCYLHILQHYFDAKCMNKRGDCLQCPAVYMRCLQSCSKNAVRSVCKQDGWGLGSISLVIICFLLHELPLPHSLLPPSQSPAIQARHPQFPTSPPSFSPSPLRKRHFCPKSVRCQGQNARDCRPRASWSWFRTKSVWKCVGSCFYPTFILQTHQFFQN